MFRYSPNPLASLVNAFRSSSTSGSYGHLSASALGPAIGVHAAMPPWLAAGLPGHQPPKASMFSSNHPLHPGHSLTKSQVTDLPYALREIVDLDGPAAVTAGARTTGIPRNRFKNRINYKGSLMSNPLSNILEIKIQRHFGLVGLNRQIINLKMEPGTTPSLPLAKNNSQMTDLGGLQTPPP
ncbi:transcriptional activator cubitus interruptus [Culex quinquefasciatus]|nr:transcriptional activator cubitus interruptus [Culex quinquefasciatus]